jgi:hypothetical protein
MNITDETFLNMIDTFVENNFEKLANNSLTKATILYASRGI